MSGPTPASKQKDHSASRPGLWHNRSAVAKTRERKNVRVGPQGRLVIPAGLRRALGIRPGQTLSARAEQGRLILERPEAIVARLKERLGGIPADVSLADELISQRRQESRRERRR